MSICDNIQYIGNTLEDNLNDRGVDCTFGRGTGEQNIYDMAELITKQNIRGIGDTNIQIIPNRPFVESGETIDVTVRLLDGVGNPLSNQIITISDGTNSYNGITNNDGIYTLFNQTITTDTTYTVSYGTETKTCKITLLTNTLLGSTYYNMDNLTTIRANNPYSQSTLSLSDDWKITDEQSLKMVVGSTAQYFGIRTGGSYLGITDDIKGKTVRFSAYINSPKQSYLSIYRYINNNWVSTNSRVSVNSGLQYAEITFTLESNADYYWFRIDTYNNSWSNGDIIYTDCWKLEIIE